MEQQWNMNPNKELQGQTRMAAGTVGQNVQIQQPVRRVIPQVTELPFGPREAINVLRGNIQLSGFGVKVIAVTSALAHEGKSNVAFRLARSLAALNKKTLYLDCDIRNSMTQSRYNIRQKIVGLSEYLCGRFYWNDIIYHTDMPYMDMIFTGAVAPNPSELLSNPLFDQLLIQARGAYEYVIVDTSPVNLVIDGVIVTKKCDGTVLVVESGITERNQAIKAKRQLEFADVHILGTVLNKVKSKKHGYGYGYGYSYGYGEKSQKQTKKQQKNRNQQVYSSVPMENTMNGPVSNVSIPRNREKTGRI